MTNKKKPSTGKKPVQSVLTGATGTQYVEVRENVRFINWGGKNVKPESIIVKATETFECLVLEVKKSERYSNETKTTMIYTVKQLGASQSDPNVIIIPTTDLSKKLQGVESGDRLYIRYDGEEKTGKGKPMKKFTVGVGKKE